MGLPRHAMNMAGGKREVSIDIDWYSILDDRPPNGERHGREWMRVRYFMVAKAHPCSHRNWQMYLGRE